MAVSVTIGREDKSLLQKETYSQILRRPEGTVHL